MELPRYCVTLELDAAGERFAGTVRIELREAPEELRLHSAGLAIESVSVDGASRTAVALPEEEQLRIAGVGPFAREVELHFHGTIPDRALVGLYRCAYGTGTLLTTMLYPNGTRRLFPCWDEPDRKAVFEVTVIADPAAEVIFNTPAARVEVADGRRRTVFAPTPKMSTYLLYLGVGTFESRATTVDGVRVLLAAPPGRAEAGEFALEHAARVLAGYNRYYGLPYPLPKLHLVSVPDFWAGAMENWGAIAFHETRLLVDPTTGARARRMTRETVTHEIAHQWFGNLVTMQSWNDFWLNESFASFMQSRLDDALYPELDIRSEFLLRFPAWGYGGDALHGSHPIEVPVPDARALGELADEVTYGKGAAVLEMIEQYLGAETFRRGVAEYLRRYAYGTARSEDFWTALESQSDRPVGQIMERWVRLVGYPVVRVGRAPEGLRVEQSRFFADGTTDGQLWPIPLTLDIDGRFRTELLESRSSTVPAAAPERVRVNPRRTGFYRVDYAPELRAELLDRFGDLDDADRWGLVNDALAFAFAGRWPVGVLAGLLRAAARFPTNLLAGEISTDFVGLEPILLRVPELWAAGSEYFRTALERWEHGGIAASPEATGSIRTYLVAGRLRTDPAYARALAERIDRLDEVEADLRGSVIVAAGRTGRPELAERLRDAVLEAPTEEQARQWAAGLAAVSTRPGLARALELALDDRMPPSRAWFMMVTLSRNPAAGGPLWSWMESHLREFERLERGTPLLSKFLETALPLVGPDRRERVRAFFDAETFVEARRGIAKGLELMDVHHAFLSRVGAGAAPEPADGA